MRAPASAIHCAGHKLHRVDLADRISFDVLEHLAQPDHVRVCIVKAGHDGRALQIEGSG